jgi:hypothetical protein
MHVFHAQSLNCHAFDLINMRDPDFLGKAVKNKTLFDLLDYFVFSTNSVASLFQRNGANS